jgi:exopolysaccharide production protein ExoZ
VTKSANANDQRKRNPLTTIQGGRAIAALLVLLFHLSTNIFTKQKYWNSDPTNNIFAFGHSGVHFFFVLSGFIIFFIHGSDIGHRARLWSYTLKRFVRIYPIYWLVLGVLLLIYFVLPSFSRGFDWNTSTIISSIALVHFDAITLHTTWTVCSNEGLHTVLPVAWTLYHEILFYLVFAVAIFHRPTGFVAMALWLLASAASLLLSDRACTLTFFATPLHLLFAMGIGACWLVQTQNVKFPRLFAAAGVALFICTGAAEDVGTTNISADMLDMLYGIGSALSIAGFVTLEQQGRVRAPAVLRLLGDASYSTYLIHFPLLSLFAKIFVRLGAASAAPPLLSFVLIFGMVAAIGIAVHLYIEKPLLKFGTLYLVNSAAARQTAST